MLAEKDSFKLNIKNNSENFDNYHVCKNLTSKMRDNLELFYKYFVSKNNNLFELLVDFEQKYIPEKNDYISLYFKNKILEDLRLKLNKKISKENKNKEVSLEK